MFKLQRLEITGFKSFADYTEVVFTGAGITAVVGPNGCGKSNISDAITWVLGEQKAKNLRGGEMQDVIFAGTKSRPASGMAEVVLHLVRVEVQSLENFDQIDDINDIDEALSDFDERSSATDYQSTVFKQNGNRHHSEANGNGHHILDAEAAAVVTVEANGSQTLAKRRWQPRRATLDFAPGEAVSITRRLYRSGDSEYLLNGRVCRLRDIQDLFAGTGLSGGHYALVQQEKISQILSAKPVDRRQLIEEAAGITKFRSRQRAAEIRLESAKTNLRRISDIVSEVEKQANGLRRQAARTRRYKELQETLHEILKKVFVAEGRELTEALANLRQQLIAAVSEENRLIAAAAAAAENARQATQAARRAEESLATTRQKAAENALRRERTSRDLAHQTEQSKELETRLIEFKQEIKSLSERLAGVSADANRLREKNEQSHASGENDSALLRETETLYQQKLAEMRRLEAGLEKVRQELLQHTTAAERFREIARQQTNALEKLAERTKGLEHEGERARNTYLERIREFEAHQTQIDEARSRLHKLQNIKQESTSAIKTARENLQTQEKSLSRIRDEANNVRTRRETLERLDANNTLLAPAVQKLFAAREKIGVRLNGTLADFLRVEAQFEKAVEAALGASLQTVLVESQADALKIAEWLQASKAGTLNLLVGNFNNTEKARASDGAEKIVELLGLSDENKALLQTVLPTAVNLRVINNLAESALFADENCVTLAGEIVYKNQFFSLSSAQPNEKGGILSFKRELRELAARAEKLQIEFGSAEAKVKTAREELQKDEKTLAELSGEIVRAERELMSVEVNAKSLQAEIERAERHKRVVEDEKKRMQNERTDVENKRQKAEADASTAETARNTANAEVAEISANLASVRKAAESVNAALSEQRATAAAASERRRSLQNALRRVEGEQNELKSRIERRNKESNEAAAKLEQLQVSLVELGKQAAAVSAEKDIEAQEITDAAQALQTARDRADSVATEVNELNMQTARAKDARSALEVSQAEIATKLQNLHESSVHELNQSLSELLDAEIIEDFQLSEGKRKVESLRDKLEGFGAVNLLALEELTETEERLLFLSSQRKDIVDGIAAAEEALAEIKRRSRMRFEHAFAEINRNFSELFGEIFGGGKGEMNLLDAADVLESGVEIVAQPPGKRLQNLLLLSGGEKALTAIALVLAIFRYRPAPFCLLDEVDAPLDEANVGRFVEKVHEMSEQIQFIVITHNKRTMEAARALYGVTMEEAGISKVVSVKFE